MCDHLPEVEANERSAAALRRLRSRRGEPLFFADWDRPLFIHFEVDPEALQRDVPFPLDRHEGRAYVSLVAFTMRAMRLRFGGALGKWLLRPIATHEFLNCRAYVRHRGEPGIFFLTEWLSNPLSVRLGPLTFGLPYRRAHCSYRHEPEAGEVRGEVVDTESNTALRYQAQIASSEFSVCEPDSLNEFLLERYTAFTAHGAKRRFFRIWHEPWRQSPAEISISDRGLLDQRWRWFRDAKLAGGNYSRGARNAWMGWPHRITVRELKPQRARRLSGFFELP